MTIDLAPFKALIKERIGLSFDDVKNAILEDGICKRMSARGIKSPAIYLSTLVSEQGEFNDLVNLITINETYFFREHAHLKLLTERLVPERLADKSLNGKVRILSAGCSTGEEPYSIVLALMEKYGIGINSFISVIGVDIDGAAIESAQKGIFGSHSFRGFPDDLKKKYFEECGRNCYRIKDFVRKKVEFRRLNLLSDSYPEELKMLDIIFYRNVSIYFEPEVQRGIFSNLASLLREDGCLFLSATETLSHNVGILSLVEMDGVFFFKKNRQQEIGCKTDDARVAVEPCLSSKQISAKRLRRTTQGISCVIDYASAAAHKRSDTAALFDDALSLAKDKNYAEALQKIDAIADDDKSFVKAQMLKASILINMKDMKEAETACIRGIEADRWCLEGYLLLGLIYKMQDDYENSLKRFKEAIYIQSSFWPAHFYLAELYSSVGELQKACREYEITMRLLTKEDKPDYGFTFFPVSFPAGSVAHVCKHRISELTSRMKNERIG